MHLASKNNLS